MGGHKIINQNEMHYLTFTVVGWVDVFTRKAYKDLIMVMLLHSLYAQTTRIRTS